MSRFGFTNIYLQAGALLILASLGCFAWIVFFAPPSNIDPAWVTWFTSASFLAGLLLYAIGRVVGIVRSRGDARPSRDARQNSKTQTTAES